MRRDGKVSRNGTRNSTSNCPGPASLTSIHGNMRSHVAKRAMSLNDYAKINSQDRQHSPMNNRNRRLAGGQNANTTMGTWSD